MPKTPLGALRDVVTVSQATTATDSHGATVRTWPGTTVVTNLPASVMAVPRGEGEVLAQGKVVALLDYDVEVMYRADLTPGMRLSWTPYLGTAKTLEIRQVRPADGAADRLMLACTELVS